MITIVRRVLALAMVLTGLAMIVFGKSWSEGVFDFLDGSAAGAWLEHLVPFVPIAVIGSGVALFVPRRGNTNLTDLK